MRKSHNFIVPLVVYPFDIFFSVGESDFAFEKAMKLNLSGKDFESLYETNESIFRMKRTCRGQTVHSFENGKTIIRIPSQVKTSTEMGTVAHEIFHAVDFIFRHAGLKLTDGSDEAYAYAIGHITEQFYYNLNHKQK